MRSWFIYSQKRPDKTRHQQVYKAKKSVIDKETRREQGNLTQSNFPRVSWGRERERDAIFRGESFWNWKSPRSIRSPLKRLFLAWNCLKLVYTRQGANRGGAWLSRFLYIYTLVLGPSEIRLIFPAAIFDALYTPSVHSRELFENHNWISFDSRQVFYNNHIFQFHFLYYFDR